MASGNAFQGMMKNQEDEMEKARKAAEASKAQSQQALGEAKQGQVAAAAGGYQTQAPPGPSAGGGNDANYKQMQDKFNASKNAAQSQLATAAGQQTSQPAIAAANANNQALSNAVPAANNPQLPMQPMAGDNPFGGNDPITDNLDTSMHGVGGTAINSGANAGITVASAGGDHSPGPSPLTPVNTGPNAGIPAPIADPMYYRDEFIDPLIKDDILQRGNVDNTASTWDAATVGTTGPMDASNTSQFMTDNMGRTAQQMQLQLLRNAADGQSSQVISDQRDRGIQDTLAMMASQRGAPTSAVMRTGMAGMSEVNRQATEAASKEQLAATQMLGDAAGAMRGQDIGAASTDAGFAQDASKTNQQISAERDSLIAQFQQQSNKSNAEMQTEMTIADTQVNAQLEKQRDDMVANLIANGTERDVALLQVNSEMGRLKEELMYKYWAGKFGGEVQTLQTLIEATNDGEDIFENIVEEGSVFNLIGGRQTPGGYDVGGTQITGPLGFQGNLGGNEFPVGPSSDGWTPEYNQPGADYSEGSTGGGGGSSNSGWYRDPNSGQWIQSGIEAKENLSNIGTSDEFFRKREAKQFGQMENAGSEFASRTSVTDPMAMQTRDIKRENPLLGNIRKGLRRDAMDRGATQDMATINARREQLLQSAEEDRVIAEGFKEGAAFVGDALRVGGLAETGISAVSGETKEEREAAARSLGASAMDATVLGGIEKTAEWADETATAMTQAAAGAGEGTAEGALSSASTAAATAAPFVGGALKFIGSTIQGQQVAPAAIGATGAGLGMAGGKVAGGAIGGAIGSIFPGAGTAIGSAIGSAVGSGVGGAAGYAATTPLQQAASSGPSAEERRKKFSRQMSPEAGLPDMASRVGAPKPPGVVYSGLETKKYIESTGAQPVSSSLAGYKPMYETYDSGGYGISDENAKMGIGKSDDELSDFLRELNPVKYDYKPEYGGEKNQYGIIAQDAQKTPVGDSFVEQNGDGTHMIDTGKATMVTMAALANQQKILDRQGDMIAQLLGEY